MVRTQVRNLGWWSVCAVAGALAVTTGADAGIIGHRWAEVDNSTLSNGAASGLNDGSLDGKIYRTFDLFLQVSQGLLTVDSGFTQSIGPNPGIEVTNTSFFQFLPGGFPNDKTPLGSIINVFPLLEFDSYVAMGTTSGSNISFAGPLTFDNTGLVGTWFVVTAAPPSENGEVRVGRFTVESSAGFGVDESATRSLGGTLVVGTADGNSTLINISNAFGTTSGTIPAPGSVGTLVGFAGLTLARRRRRG